MRERRIEDRSLVAGGIMGVESFLAIPTKAGLFPVLPSELEKSKTDYLKRIVVVRPVGDGY